MRNAFWLLAMFIGACGDDDEGATDAAIDARDGAPRDGPDGGADADAASDAAPPLPPVAGPGRLALGEHHSCHVRDDGSLWCWGASEHAQRGDGVEDPVATAQRVGTANDWIQISAEKNVTCGLRGQGELHCFGRDEPITRVGTDLWRTIDVGEAFFDEPVCGVTIGGALYCWTTITEPVRVGTEVGWARAVAGDDMHCALKDDGSAWCWERGDATSVPARHGMQTYLWIDVGQHYACGVQNDGTLECWGEFLDDFPATPLSGTYTSIGLGFGHGCAVTDGGSLVCDGGNRFGEGGRAIGVRGPFAIDGEGFVEIATGANHTCGRRADDTVACFGHNEYGELGGGTLGLKHTPTQVGSSTSWDAIFAGSKTTCGRQSGAWYCWGDVSFGMGFDIAIAPTTLSGAANFTQVEPSSHTCAIDGSGNLWCWGSNSFGQVGDGTDRDRSAPYMLAMGPGWTDAAVGSSHSCAIHDGALSCWGRNNAGQLGIGSRVEESYTGVAVGSAGWLDVAAGGQASCGVQIDGSLHCWGSIVVGDPPRSPMRVGTELGWQRAFVGESMTPFRCALDGDDALHCIGSNSRGQLGDGTTMSRDTLVAVAGGHAFAEVGLGGSNACGLTTDGELYCWGSAEKGQLGRGDYAQQATPVRVGSDTWSALAVGSEHVCAIRDDRSLWCWGSNEYGELGDGTAMSSTPVDVR